MCFRNRSLSGRLKFPSIVVKSVHCRLLRRRYGSERRSSSICRYRFFDGIICLLLERLWIYDIVGLNGRSRTTLSGIVPQSSTRAREEATSSTIGSICPISVLNDRRTSETYTSLFPFMGPREFVVEELHDTENITLFQAKGSQQFLRDIHEILFAHFIPYKG